MTDLERLEKKLDLILDALGLTDNRRMTPIERSEHVKSSILKFRQKQIKKGHVCEGS